MFDLMMGHVSTILVGAVIAAGLIAVVVKMIRDKKKGKSSCGCNCAECPGAGMCHTK